MTRRSLPLDSNNNVKSLGRALLNNLLKDQTASALAKRCGCSHSAISRLAAGKTKDPAYQLRKALGALGIDPDAWDQPNDGRLCIYAQTEPLSSK